MARKSTLGVGTRITSVSLDDETFHIKETLIKTYGFSAWIRECLRRYAREHLNKTGDAVHTMDEENRIGGLCNGLNPNLCPICWPDGRPSQKDWMGWVSGSSEKPRPEITPFSLPNDEAQDKGHKTPVRNDPKVGLIRRFIGWLW